MNRAATRRCLVSASLALLACAATAQLRYLPGDNAVSLAASSQTGPSLAQGGNKVLAVWTDNRSNPYASYEYETSKDVYGMRFDGDGNPLDPTPFPLAVFPGAQESPKVAWNGTNWLVVFETTGLSGTGYYYQRTMAAVRVSPTGQLLDSHPIPLTGLQPSSSSQWDVASDGDNWVVVCQGTSVSSSVVAMRVSPEGLVLDPPNRVLVQATYYLRFNFRLAYAAGVFLLTFDDNYIGGTNVTALLRFDSSLTPLNPAPVGLLDHPVSGLSSNGSVFYLVSVRQMPNFSVRVNGNRVSTSGQKLDGDGVDISGGFQPQAYWGPAVAWTGAQWRITWGSSSTLRMASVTAAGAVVNPGGVAVSGVQSGPIAAAGDGGVQTAWSVFQNSSYDVQGSHIRPDGTATGVGGLSVGVPAQLRSDSATSGNGYMVVYRSSDSATARVLAQPLDAAGNSLGKAPVVLATGANVNGPTSPNVVWTGVHYMVAWSDGATVLAQRLLPDGTRVDSNPFVVMSGYFGPSDLAVSGDIVLVLARKTFQNGQIISVFGARVRASDATVLDATPLGLGGTYVRTPPAVVELGGRFLAAYHSNVTHDNPSCMTMGAFVPPSGAAGAPFNIHGSFSTAGGNGIFEVGLASNGSVAIMVQSQELTSGVENDMLCRFIDANGTVSAYQNLTPWPGNQYRPKVAWDGRSFVIAYQEQKNRTAYWTLDQIDARSDLFGMRVAANGAVLDPLGFVFSASQDAETDPSICAANGVSLMTGSLMDNRPDKSNYRIAYSLFGSSKNQNPVAVATATPDGGDAILGVSFSSAGSRDPDGTIVSTFWDFGDGWTSTEPNPSHFYILGMPAVARLTVEDDAGAKTTQAILVWPTTPNELPVAIGVANPSNGAAPLDVVFGADGSFDPDGLLGNIEWLFGDDQSTYWGSTAYHTFTRLGIWPVDLTIWDSRQETGTSRLFVVVGPSAAFSPTEVATTVGTHVGGDVSSLAGSDDQHYVIEEGPATFKRAPVAQMDTTFVLDQASVRGFVIRVEGSINAIPAENVRRRIQAFNTQTQSWDLIDERQATSIDIPQEVVVETGASRYVDPVSRAVRVRVAWTVHGALNIPGLRLMTDQIRLTVRY